jgi:chorismate synthase
MFDEKKEEMNKKVSFTWGNNIKLTIYGESHGSGVGIIIDGLRSGIKLNYSLINQELTRRKTNTIVGTTKRNESDDFNIVSGIFNGVTNGGPLNVFFPNQDTKSKDYTEFINKPRPSHADYPAGIKYEGFNDYRGGGFFSARLTAPIVFAGAIAKGILLDKDIEIFSHVLKIGEKITDINFSDVDNIDALKDMSKYNRLMIDQSSEIEAIEMLKRLSEEGESVGAKIECQAINIPIGTGDPYFNSVESDLSSLIFSIPGVKAVEFGLGEKFSESTGSKVNDEYYVSENGIKTFQNNNGGILGGLTTGMPINFKVTFKPTPSLTKPQRTVNLSELKNTTLTIKGRHDTCIAIRGRVVVEAVLAIVLLNFIY